MPTALIATALAVETDAVTAHLVLDAERVHDRGTRYPNGSFEPGGWHVVVVETGKGNARAAVEVARAIDFVSPSLALFVGVAGGVKDVVVGDVVVGDKVYYTESGKTTSSGGDAEAEFRPRPEADRGDYRLIQLARSLARSGTWKARVMGGLYRPAPVVDASVEIGPIAAGEKVIAATRSAAFELIREAYGDSVAVEMEGHGFSLAAYASGGTPGLVVRGISDLVDGKAASDSAGSQPVAAARAAAFAFEVLAAYASPVTPGQTAMEVDWVNLRETAAALYPEGPSQRALWERAGGDPAQLPRRDDGRTAWFEALKTVRNGGGGSDLTASTLLREMRHDFPRHPDLA